MFNSVLIKNMKTPLITKEGLEKLKAELDHLWRVERPDTTQKVSWAASLGDRSENADLSEEPHFAYYFSCYFLKSIT